MSDANADYGDADLHRMEDGEGRIWEWSDSPMARYCYINGTPSEQGVVAKTVDAGKGVNIDYDAQGNVLGIEFLCSVPDVWGAPNGRTVQ